MLPETKYCKGCDTTKAAAEFHVLTHRDGAQQLAWRCKPCSAKYGAARNRVAYKGKWAEYKRQQRANRPEHYLAISLKANRKSRLEHPERHRRYESNWRRSNPAAYRAIRWKVKAKRLNAVGTVTAREWRDRLAEYNDKCAYCLVADSESMEHMQPLSRGGRHSIENIVPACMKCNCQKGKKTLIEYTLYKQQLGL